MTESNSNEFEQEYKDHVKTAIEDGSYFKDAFNWYSRGFILPIAERTFYTIISILGLVIIIMSSMIINSVLPVKESVPIIIRAKNTTKYKPIIHNLKNKAETKSTDEAVLRFLAINYIKEREQHNYKKASIKEYNKKLNRIRNNSSSGVYEEFKRFMSKSNKNSPIHFFGKNVERKIYIESFNFVKVKKISFIDKLKGFLALEILPSKAYVHYTMKTFLPNNNVLTEKRRTEIGFKFNGIKKDKKTKEFLPLKFLVIEYKNY